MLNRLQYLQSLSKLGADTADISLIDKYQLPDVTTNPTLIRMALELPEYARFVQQAKDYALAELPAESSVMTDAQIALAYDYLCVLVGAKLAQTVRGNIFTEVDIHTSFDTQATVERARRLIAMYSELGVASHRIYIKVAATWEGIQAARILEAEGIKCNITLIFSLVQARAAAEAGASMIAPYVGRVTDYYKELHPESDYSGIHDPGVKLVQWYYSWFDRYNYPTEIMAASFRTSEQVVLLAGCHRLTIGPKVLEELSRQKYSLSPRLVQGEAHRPRMPDLTEQEFRTTFQADKMASTKFAEGVAGFTADTVAVYKLFEPTLV